MNSLKKPKLSVIVPNYNYARFLNARIGSILNQSFQDFELILLDDCSTDNSREVLECYRNNPHVSHIVFNEQNSGSPFIQWMKGIELARGKYIWIAEADDMAEPAFLEKSIEYLMQYPNAVASVTGTTLIDSDGNIIPKKANYWDKKGMERYRLHSHRIIDGHLYCTHKLYWACCIQNTSQTVFRRESALNLSNSQFLTMRHSGDWLFWIQMASQGDIVEIYDNLNLFRQHNQKVTIKGQQSGKSIEEDIQVISFIEQMYPQISRYRMRLAHGMLWRKIKKYPCDENEKNRLRMILTYSLNSTISDYHNLTLNRYLRFLIPHLPTMERDRKYN